MLRPLRSKTEKSPNKYMELAVPASTACLSILVVSEASRSCSLSCLTAWPRPYRSFGATCTLSIRLHQLQPRPPALAIHVKHFLHCYSQYIFQEKPVERVTNKQKIWKIRHHVFPAPSQKACLNARYNKDEHLS